MRDLYIRNYEAFVIVVGVFPQSDRLPSQLEDTAKMLSQIEQHKEIPLSGVCICPQVASCFVLFYFIF
jgi:hypothetical protein